MFIKDLLAKIVSSNSKTIAVDIYDNKGLQLINFDLPGYESLSDEVLDAEVDKLTIVTLNKIRIDLV